MFLFSFALFSLSLLLVCYTYFLKEFSREEAHLLYSKKVAAHTRGERERAKMNNRRKVLLGGGRSERKGETMK